MAYFKYLLSHTDDLSNYPYDIVSISCCTDESLTHPYVIHIVIISNGWLTNSPVWHKHCCYVLRMKYYSSVWYVQGRVWYITPSTHWGRSKMAAIFQTTSLNAFSWMKVYEFRSRFPWSLFPRVQLTISQHWPLSEPMLVCLLKHICVTRPHWVSFLLSLYDCVGCHHWDQCTQIRFHRLWISFPLRLDHIVFTFSKRKISSMHE